MALDKTAELVLDSWNRQAAMVAGLAEFVTEDLRHLKPSDDGMALDEQLCHINFVRKDWLSTTGSKRLDDLGDVFQKVGDHYEPIGDLDEIRRQLRLSAAAIGGTFTDFMMPNSSKIAQYENPVLLIQHMIWHEGYHAALILLALRLAGCEPSEEWAEAHLWEPWRGVEIW